MTDPVNSTPGFQTLTNELMAEIAAEHNGWTRAQLEILGVPWPPPEGWRKEIVAVERFLTDAVVARLFEARMTATERRSQLGESPPEADQKAETVSLSATLREITCNRLRVRKHRQREYDDVIVGDCLTEFPKPARDWLVENGWLSEDEANDKRALAHANQGLLRRLAEGAITLAPKPRTDD